MYIPTEWLLAAALVVIYLFDSAVFLRLGEALVVSRHNSVRRLDFGSSFEFGGRRPFLPNPFTPWRPALRIDWDVSGRPCSSPAAASAEMTARLSQVVPIGWLSTGCAFLIVLVAPLALVTGQQQLFVAAAALTFLLSLSASILLLRRRHALELSLWQAISLLVIALVCLPCAGNLARSVCAQKTWTLPAAQLPELDRGAAEKRVTATALLGLLTRTQRLLPEDGIEYRTLSEQVKQLEAAYSEHK
jgi:hypothetical protein